MNGISRWHPVVLLTYFVSVLFVAMFSADPLLTALTLCGGVTACAATGSIRRARDGVWYAAAAGIVTFTNPLFSHLGETPLFFLFGHAYTLEALVYGAVSGVTLTAVLLWCRCMSAVMTQEKWFALFGKRLPKLALLLTMTMRLIPQTLRQGRQMWQAQRAMRLADTSDRRARVRSAARLTVTLMSRMTDQALDTARSMQARGYGLSGRTAYTRRPFAAADGLGLAVCLFLAALTVYGLVSGACGFTYYPRLDGGAFSMSAVAAYAAFAVLVHIPLIVSIKEHIQWLCYRSNI